MNVFSASDLELANTFTRVIKLGASPKDLTQLFPLYFGLNNSTDKAAREKAIRVYNDLKPLRQEIINLPGRHVAFHNLVKPKPIRKPVSNWLKFCYPHLIKTHDQDDLSGLFIELYESWALLTKHTPSLNFQQALSAFTYLASALKIHGQEKVFRQCKACGATHPNYKHDLLINNHPCPYCS